MLRAGDTLAGLRIPDSRMAREALDLVRDVSSELLLNHVLRSYFFGRLLAETEDGLDQEVVFLSAVLHDLGLTDHARGARRFELEGADAARLFLLDKGYAPGRAWLVWDTIALHPWGDINLHKEAEARATQLGIMADAVGLGVDRIEPAKLAEILRVLPRLSFKSGFLELLRQEAVAKPESHVMHPVHMVAEHCCYHVPVPDAAAMLQA